VIAAGRLVSALAVVAGAALGVYGWSLVLHRLVPWEMVQEARLEMAGGAALVVAGLIGFALLRGRR